MAHAAAVADPIEVAPGDPAALSDDRLAAEITTLAGHIAAAMCRWLLLVAEFDRREAWGAWDCRSCVHWLSWRCGVSSRTAQEQLRVAHALGRLPLVRAHFASGELSYSKVRAITRVAVEPYKGVLLALRPSRHRAHAREGGVGLSPLRATRRPAGRRPPPAPSVPVVGRARRDDRLRGPNGPRGRRGGDRRDRGGHGAGGEAFHCEERSETRLEDLAGNDRRVAGHPSHMRSAQNGPLRTRRSGRPA